MLRRTMLLHCAWCESGGGSHDRPLLNKEPHSWTPRRMMLEKAGQSIWTKTLQDSLNLGTIDISVDFIDERFAL
jgi:hypothetical protein